MPAMIFQIAINAPLHGLFDYLPPADWTGDAGVVGSRVEVTFGRGKTTGLIAGTAPDSSLPRSRLRKITRILDQQPVMEPAMLELLMWAASYYQHPVGEVIAAALPLGLRQGRPLGGLEQVWHLTPAGAQQDPDVLARRAPRQGELWKRLEQSTGGVSETTLSGLPKGWRNTLKRMLDKGWVGSREQQPGAGRELLIRPGPELTTDQSRAAALITGATGFSPFLLFGVTGSGKTEVYFEAMEQVLAAGRQVLFLVPEIGLTPQLLERVRNRFDGNLAILHSGLSDGERLASWRDAASGAAHIIIGTRSAALAPMARPGMIIVDEEHDPSFKQWEGFRYSARDMAVARARRHGVSVVLGSATPSLESLYNVRKGRYTQLDLPERPGAVNHPEIRLVDLRAHACDEGLSTPLVLAAEKHLAGGGQVLFFLNRRGYAPTLFCPGCGWTARCKRCDAGMVVHQRQQLLRCHHCDTQRKIPENCEDCHEVLAPVGQGTERVEETLNRVLPGYPQVRIDRDSTQRKGAMEELLGKIRSGQARILTGTQMLTKGHDFPDVSLVGVLNADQGLFGTDFRASERLAQTIVQVAGRAGRAERPGLVLIQTLYPEHPLLTRLVNDGYAAFAEACLKEREESGWPPFSHLALLRAESPGMPQTLAFLHRARQILDLPTDHSVGVLGPAPAPMEKRAGRYRGQLLLEARERPILQRLLTEWLSKVRELPEGRKVRWSIDVDPIELF
ncbi:MAG: primosomal protein N' [Gammaproteobacteria bacterium]|nr:primosomal protein N' [Gammaproteobacteria bacterium]